MVIKYIFNKEVIALVNHSEQAPLVGDEVLITPECFPYENHIIIPKLYIVKQRRFIPECTGNGEVMCIILDDTRRDMNLLKGEEENDLLTQEYLDKKHIKEALARQGIEELNKYQQEEAILGDNYNVND